MKELFFLNFLKAVSILAVVSYHSIFVPVSTYQDSFFLIDLIFAPLRFCVPIYLSISFFLYEQGYVNRPMLSPWTSLKKRLTRLAIPTCFWYGTALILKLVNGATIQEVVQSLMAGEIFTGAYYFLVLYQLIFVYYLIRNRIHNIHLKLSIFVHFMLVLLIGILLFFYHDDLFITVLRTLNRPPFFYWLVYIPLGILCYRNLHHLTRLSNKVSRPIKVILLLGMAGCFFIEYAWLEYITEQSVPPFEYMMFTCVLSVPILFLCFSSLRSSQIHGTIRSMIQILSKYSLGIFCINGILSQILLSFGNRWFHDFTFDFTEILFIKVLGFFILMTLSISISFILHRLGFKYLVC
jgi:hypothetical protein